MIGRIPVIGILAARYHETFYKVDYSVYEWLKASGALVIYIDPRLSRKEIIRIFNSLDGIVIPGGAEYPFRDILTYESSKLIFQLAEIHGNFPVLGICMGLQFMLTYYSGGDWDAVKTVVCNYGYSSKTSIVNPLEGTFLSSVPIQLIDGNLAFNHKNAILLKTFEKYPKLGDTFELLTTSQHKDWQFVSSIQGKKYPIFGVQWHPEKPKYEWSEKQNIIRNDNAIKIGKCVGDFFVQYCRGTKNKTPLKIFMDYNLNNLKLTSHRYLRVDDESYYDEPLIKYILE